jgi:hypothetical protein
MKDGFEGLKAYELAYAGAMKIFRLSKESPRREVFAVRSDSAVFALSVRQYRGGLP